MQTQRILTFLWLVLVAGSTAVSQPSAPPPAIAPSPGGVPSTPHPPQQRNVERRIVIHNGSEDGGMGIVPPGTWWKNPATVASLSLSAEQQRKMDDIFRQNRLQLIDNKASLEKEQINLEPLLNANPIDSGKAYAEISRIADLRADLEKTNAKMLLALRGVLSGDQWTRLQAEQRSHRDGPGLFIERRGTGAGSGSGLGVDGPAGPGGMRGHGPSARFGALDLLSPESGVHEIDLEGITLPEIHIAAQHIHIPAVEGRSLSVPAMKSFDFEIPAIDLGARP